MLDVGKEEGKGGEVEEVYSVEEDEDASLDKAVKEATESVREKGNSEAKIEALEAELLNKTQEAKKAEERYRYLLADFENYKKRIHKEQSEQIRFANERLIKEMLVVLDDLERAILHLKEAEDFSKMVEGLELIVKQFLSFLNRFGVIPIDSKNKSFDPAYHQAMGQMERSDCEENQVIEETQRGYLLYDRLIRPSMVIVSKKSTPFEKGSEPLGESFDKSV